jgi:ribokinase
MISKPPATVDVFGSLNMDEVIRVARFPAPGETMMTIGVAHHPGGKGANQAVAAARAGASVKMIGAIGSDAAGEALLGALLDEGIDCRGIRRNAQLPTGKAYVLVDDHGENQVLVSPGANAEACARNAGGAQVFLSQLECPLHQVALFLEGRPCGAIGMLNAAPFIKEAVPIFENVDVLVVNETELASYCGVSVPSSPHEAAAVARTLMVSPSQTIVVTLGKRGSVTVDREGATATAAFAASVVDTTAAGDCFCGFLAAQISQGCEFRIAVERAHRAAGLAVGRSGAMASIPFVTELGIAP